jgi:Peptidase S24-like
MEFTGEGHRGHTVRIRQDLRRRRCVCIRVQGSSMLPWVRPGDMLLVHSAAMEEARCGDVVLFERGGRLFAHRLIEKRGGRSPGFIAKGDAHPKADGFLPAKDLFGRVACIYRGGKRIDLDSPRQLALGRLISGISRHSRIWDPAARMVFRAAYPLRRLLPVLRPFGAPVH